MYNKKNFNKKNLSLRGKMNAQFDNNNQSILEGDTYKNSFNSSRFQKKKYIHILTYSEEKCLVIDGPMLNLER